MPSGRSAAGQTGFKVGSKLGIRTTDSYYDPVETQDRSEDDYAVSGVDRDDRTVLQKAQDWWAREPFWQRILFGGVGTVLLLTVVSLLAYGIDKGTGIDDPPDSVYSTFQSTVPAGCLGPPFILIDFHGGQSKNSLQHHRYNEVLKYTRDGCFLGQANQALNSRLRGMRVWGDRLYAVVEGGLGLSSNVVRFGGCGKSTAMRQRALLDEQVISSTKTACNQHIFDLDSFDQGKTLYLSDQGSGTVTRFNVSTGQAIPTGAPATSCPGLVANWTDEATGAPGLGVRGLCTSGARLFMPYKFSQGLVSVTLGGAGATELEKQVADRQPAHQPGVVDYPNRNIAHYPYRLDLYDAQDDPVKYGGERGWFLPGLTTAKPVSCRVIGDLLFFPVRRDEDPNSFSGAVEYNLVRNTTRVFTHSAIGVSQALLVHQGVLYLLARAESQSGHQGGLDLLTGDIFRFNLSAPDPKQAFLGALSPKVAFPDQPITMVFSDC